MILIADSGSTKTDWRLVDKKKQFYQFHTLGFNPYFQDSKMIASELDQNLRPSIEALSITNEPSFRIYFYGAGCSSEEKCNIVKSAVTTVFPSASVFVEHDLLAAARALFHNQPGIAAIMGTGSNSCVYNGKEIVANVASLGYILGDEGSGAYIGKQFIQDYLNKEVPLHIAENFKASYNLSQEDILDAVYKQPMPSRFLASFSKFINRHREENYFKELVKYNFEQFFTKHICKYEDHKNLNLACVGSVAYYYSDILRDVAQGKGVRISKIIESPISDLTGFHLQEQTSSIQK